MLSTDVYNYLLNKCLEGELLPGEMISRQKVAEECGVSLAPVAEAIARMEYEGFLRTVPRKGTFVRFYSKDEIMGSLILKEGIECAAALRYSEKEILANYEKLHAMAEAVDAKTNQDKMQRWRNDLDFHKELVSLAGYPVLTEAYSRVAVPNLFHYVYVPFTESSASHLLLLENMKNPDRQAALAFLREHLWGGKKL